MPATARQLSACQRRDVDVSESLGAGAKCVGDRRANNGGVGNRKDGDVPCEQAIHPSADARHHVSEGFAAMGGSVGILQPFGDRLRRLRLHLR